MHREYRDFMRVRLPALLWDLSATLPHPGGRGGVLLGTLSAGDLPQIFQILISNIIYQNSLFSTAFFKPDLRMKLHSDSLPMTLPK